MPGSVAIMSAEDVGRATRRIAHEIIEKHPRAETLVLVGIHTRGVPLAVELAEAIDEFASLKVPVGELDIGLYRDDVVRLHTPEPGMTLMPGDIAGQDVILVDDVLYTGRTVRAALDALTDLGRPSSVELAVLADRGHRQLPIKPDYVGKNLPTAVGERVSVRLAAVDGVTGVWIERASGADE